MRPPGSSCGARPWDWLRDELKAWKKVAMTVEPGNKPLASKTLAHWKADGDLAGVRDADALANLPGAERKQWQALWADVESLRTQTVTK